jgi:hypothetical protein
MVTSADNSPYWCCGGNYVWFEISEAIAMTSNKSFAYAVLLGNIIGMILYASILSLPPPEPAISTHTTSILGVNITTVNVNPNYDKPQTGISIIDMLVAVYFTLSTTWAIWVIVNPFSG